MSTMLSYQHQRIMVIRRAALTGALLAAALALCVGRLGAAEPGGAELPKAEPARADLILHHGKIVTVDAAVLASPRRWPSAATGSWPSAPTTRCSRWPGPNAARVDLGGKTVLPGLIDSHAHPVGAAIYEFDHPGAGDGDHRRRARPTSGRGPPCSKPGQWIRVAAGVHHAAPRAAVSHAAGTRRGGAAQSRCAFRTGPDAALNSLALKLSGIDKDFKITDGQAGPVERDPATGEPTGILRNCHRFIKYEPSGEVARRPTTAAGCRQGPAGRLQRGGHHRRHRPRRRRGRRSGSISSSRTAAS